MKRSPGFTLIEMMVSMSLLALMALALVSITGQTTRIWQYTSSRSDQFNAAGLAFETMTQRLSQATLNTYWDYDSVSAPKRYLRKSELRFVTGKTQTLLGTSSPRRPGSAVFFQAPLGFSDDPNNYGEMPNLLNTWGYYLEFNKDDRPLIIDNLTPAPPARWRYRIIELMEPSNFLSVYSYMTGSTSVQLSSFNSWFTNPVNNYNTSKLPDGTTGKVTHALADNIIQFIVLPRLSKVDEQKETTAVLSTDYTYDSAYGNAVPPVPLSASDPKSRWNSQLPPVVQVTMVAIDEPSAARLTRGSTLPTFDSDLGSNSFTVSSTSAAYNSAIYDKYNKDLQTLTDALAAKNINFRVFTSNVSIRGARWSTN